MREQVNQLAPRHKCSIPQTLLLHLLCLFLLVLLHALLLRFLSLSRPLSCSPSFHATLSLSLSLSLSDPSPGNQEPDSGY